MTTQDQLVKLYESWGTLSDSEGEAIRTGNWAQVAEVQRAKETLQEQIMAKTGVLAQSVGGFAVQDVRERVHEMLYKLIQQEKQNQSALSEARQLADEEASSCKTAGNNLRQLHKAYSGERPSTWQSYS